MSLTGAFLKATSGSNLKKIAKLLDKPERGEDFALSYLERLNIAGLDLKGQTSSAYAMSGIGMKASAGIDLGKGAGPLLHLTGTVSVSGEATANALVTLNRTSSKAWFSDMEQPPQPDPLSPSVVPPMPHADWQTKTPLALGFLRGKSGTLSGDIALGAWAGIGNPKDKDETGLSIGFNADAGVTGQITSLSDDNPKFFGPRYQSDDMKDAVASLMDYNLKGKAISWLLINGNGVTEARAAGAPVPLLVTLAKGMPDNVAVIAKHFDDATIPDVATNNIAGNANTAFKVFAKIAKRLDKGLAGGHPSTDYLVKLFDECIAAYRQHITTLQGTFYEGEHERLRVEIWLENRDVIDVCDMRIREAEELKESLVERKRLKDIRQSKRSWGWGSSNRRRGEPRFYLHIAVISGQAGANAGVKANFTGKTLLEREKPLFQQSANADIRIYGKRIKLRYQTFARDAKSKNRDLISTQETLISHVAWTAKLIGNSSGPNMKTREGVKSRDAWTTLSYRSVLVNWFDDLQANNHASLPNGSGVSFGMSVSPGFLTDYIRACKPAKGTTALPSSLPDNIQKIEDAMTQQLRVTPDELRRFMRNQAPGLKTAIREDDCFLVESAFAFTRQEKLTIVDHQATSLFKLTPAHDLMDVDIEKGDNRPNGVRLQTIRLRIRVRDDKDRARSPLTYGANPKLFSKKEEPVVVPGAVPSVEQVQGPFAKLGTLLKKFANKIADSTFFNVEDENGVVAQAAKIAELPIKLGFSAERISRVGTEGIVDVNIIYFPSPYAGLKKKDRKFAEAAQSRNLSELQVPGVTLFSQ